MAYTANLPATRDLGYIHAIYSYQPLKKPEGPKVKASGGEAVWLILRTSGNAGFGALRLFQQGLRPLQAINGVYVNRRGSEKKVINSS
jgi:hypothetical protein